MRATVSICLFILRFYRGPDWCPCCPLSVARLAAFAQMLFLQPQPLQHHARRSLLDLQFLAVLRGEGTSVLTDTKEINRKKIQKITSFYLNSLFLLNAFYNLHNQTKCGRLEPEKDGSGGCAESMTMAWCLVKDRLQRTW